MSKIIRFPLQQMLEIAVNQAHLKGLLICFRALLDAPSMPLNPKGFHS